MPGKPKTISSGPGRWTLVLQFADKCANGATSRNRIIAIRPFKPCLAYH